MYLSEAIVSYPVGFLNVKLIVKGDGGNMCGKDLHYIYQCFPHPSSGITPLGVPREIF
jgi:hypothetical protein